MKLSDPAWIILSLVFGIKLVRVLSGTFHQIFEEKEAKRLHPLWYGGESDLEALRTAKLTPTIATGLEVAYSTTKSLLKTKFITNSADNLYIKRRQKYQKNHKLKLKKRSGQNVSSTSLPSIQELTVLNDDKTSNLKNENLITRNKSNEVSDRTDLIVYQGEPRTGMILLSITLIETVLAGSLVFGLSGAMLIITHFMIKFVLKTIILFFTGVYLL